MTPAWRDAAWLVGGTLLALLLLQVAHLLARGPIEAQAQRARGAELDRLLAPLRYDNDPFADRIQVRAPAWLGSDRAQTVLRVRQQGRPAALVLDVVAPDGFGGPIRLQVALRADGALGGVRVRTHRETPGLGGQVEDDDWLARLRGRSLQHPPRERWRVRRDGGEFDQFAGASITPRAVVAALRHALDYGARHGDALYAAPSGTLLEHRDAPEP
jgi:electron transport complex protein RnfG